ncbi:hypothetical protein COLO4_09367 [Corchorus olitorius]|uniref:Bifunctional inhibitor/plant lipid transfer protein/seed storage helical domain-containing protein n=1 Tax=Corchorus olitorius TaxID=93759 RepID=A0A1R3KCA2_9ROSI|nr:hypothetical protein COLO4_09367 [Corchorus olitorius]
MKRVSSVALCMVAALAVVVFLGETRTAEAVTCSVTELSPCVAAITSGSAPTGNCCSKLKEQKPCFCQYINNPALKPYINSPNAKKVASACGVSYPKC